MSEINQREYQTVILGALLHDIGKFYQRGLKGKKEKHTKLGEECFEENFRERLSFLFNNEELNAIESGIGNHHDYAQYITPADWISAGLDRIPLDDEEKGISSEERLLAVFDEISLINGTQKPPEHSYSLKPLDIDRDNLFPKKFVKENLEDIYKILWNNFTNELKNIPTTSLRSYLNALYALLEKYTWCIPSATYKDEPDVSLFDHVKTTAAITGCLYYHEKLGDKDTKPFLLIAGDISGIQNFIYRITKAQGTGGVAKRLRGRSFYLSLLQEVIAKYIVEQIGLFKTNILFCGGGRFELLLPNTTKTEEVINNARQDINAWLLKKFGGEISIILEGIDADGNDLKEYASLLEQLDGKLARAKKLKFLLAFEGNDLWVKPIDRQGITKICSVCNTNELINDISVCNLCELHKEIGGILPNVQYIIYTDKKVRDINGLEISFDNFGVIYLVNQEIKEDWLKLNDIIDIRKINSTDNLITGFSFIGNTVPVATEGFSIDIQAEEEDKKIEKGDVLSFEFIAEASIGDKRLGIIKMDVDYLGLIFAIGFEGRQKSISRIATLSRMLEMFFGGYLNRICDEAFNKWYLESQWEHKNKVNHVFYIVYSGGDDLLIVGPWSEMPELAKRIRDEFKEYTCNNPDINISAGVFFCKPKYPISLAAKGGGEQLETSKDKGRKRITLFGDTVEWASNDNACLDELLSFGEDLYQYITNDDLSQKLPRGFVHGLLRKHKQYNGGQDYRFIPAIIYQLVRNVKDDELRKELKAKLITDKNGYFKHIKIPASYALLKSRKED